MSVEVQTWDIDDDSVSIVVVTTDTDVMETVKFGGMDGVDARYEAAKDSLDAATKAIKDNKRVDNVTDLAEEERRAKALYDHFAAQKAKAEKALREGKLMADRVGDDPSTADEEADVNMYTSLYTVEEYEALTDLQGTRDDAAEALKAAYDARVAASTDVEANQRDTQKYLDQLVKLRQGQKAAADAARPATAEEDTAAQKTAAENLATAEAQLALYNELQALDDANPVKALVNSLVAAEDSAEDDDGQALVDAISSNYGTASDAKATADRVAGEVMGLTGDDGAVSMNMAAIEQETQDRMAADGALGMRIDTNWDAIAVNQMDIDALEAEDVRLEGRIDTNWDAIAVNQMDIDANEVAIGNNMTSITTNSTMIGENASAITRNSGMITDNRNMIGELSESLEVVRAGVAASMALAGMPAINGRGISIGVGSFDGESAFAVGFQIQNEATSFKVGVTSSGGATGASAGVGFQF